jgi:lactate dehydrogenase-like 2-hydroxyacid dehydrogenase
VTKTGLLVDVQIFEGGLDGLSDEFDINHIVDEQERAKFLKSDGGAIKAVLTNGTKGLTREELALMPNLKLISCIGAGYEKIDVEAAKRRGIAISHGPGTNEVSVADHSFALLFSIVRRIPSHDTQVKHGGWKTLADSWPTLTGKTLGILGLGRIGMLIASRASGFEMAVHYHSRSKRDDVDYIYEHSAIDLATASDFLIVVCPGGRETHHLVDAAVLEALGPSGYLVSVGRGSVVDNTALVTALQNGKIAAAGLDVFDGEPEAPQELLEAPHITFTPHVAGRSPEARSLMVDLFQRNLKNFFSGAPLVTPIPEMADQ